MKLVSLNVEGDKHYARWVPWVQAQAPDVLCLQELCEEDMPALVARVGMAHFAFAPLTKVQPGNKVKGQGFFSKMPLQGVQVVRYGGKGHGRDDFINGTPEEKEATSMFSLLVGEVEGVKVITTHFPWMPNGEADDIQRVACAAMLEKLKNLGEFVLCGDFNAPRGKEIFDRISAAYTDNIPAQYVNSIDKTLHRVGLELPDYMVDGLFTTQAYRASSVALHGGVSDHMGVFAVVVKV